MAFNRIGNVVYTRLRNKYNMKTIIGTQIGFLIGNIILITLLDFELKMVIATHLILTLGYFCRYIQERVANNEV